jgi:transcriptional regulator with XRE-family HTH domain
MSRIGDWIVRRRKARGWTRAELARRLGVAWQTLWQWETGRRIPRAESEARLVRELEKKKLKVESQKRR